MYVYIAIILLEIIISSSLGYQNSESVLMSEEYSNSSYKRKIALTCMVLVFFAGFRYSVGADYWQYVSNYNAYLSSPLSITGEPGIRLVTRVCSLIYKAYPSMFFGMSLLTVGLCTTTIAKNSPLFIVSILLYIFLGCWHESFNSVRQSAAAAILFWGHSYIKNRDFKRWIAVCFIAYLFHTSSIIFILLYYVPKKNVKFHNVLVLAIVGFIGARMYEYIWRLIGIIQAKAFVLDIYSQQSINVFRIIVAWIPIFFYFIFIHSHENEITSDDEAMNFYLNISVISASLILAARNSAYLGRIVIYTELYNTLAWAHIFYRFKDNRSRNYIILIVFIIICYFIYYLFEASGEHIVNYKWIFGNV